MTQEIQKKDDWQKKQSDGGKLGGEVGKQGGGVTHKPQDMPEKKKEELPR